jgi:anti-sigma-K factor RskA
MSTQIPPPQDREPGSAEPPDDDVLAGEFVLGVLSEAERRAAQARTQADPAFAARIAAWERRLAPWLSEVAPVRVPEELWQRLRRGLGWADAAPAPSWWRSLTLWRSCAALAAVAAIASWLTRPPVPVAPPTAAIPGAPEPAAKPVTTLAHDDGTPGWLASVDRTRGTLLMVPVPAPADAQGRVPELWIIAAGHAPRSLGAVSINEAHTVEVPPDSRAALSAPGSVLAITLEPAGGMPHAAPSGPIVAKGAITI